MELFIHDIIHSVWWFGFGWIGFGWVGGVWLNWVSLNWVEGGGGECERGEGRISRVMFQIIFI